MDLSRLYGLQYVRIAPDVAETLSQYLGVPVHEGEELAVTLEVWPREIRPAPLRARDGRLIAGDPVLLGANDRGLVFDSIDGHTTVVPWSDIVELQVLGRPIPRSA
jgi:hypothetical protein